MLHEAESELYQKLLVADIFPGILLIGYISVTKHAKTARKYFFGITKSGKSIGTYGSGQVLTLIFFIFNAEVSLSNF